MITNLTACTIVRNEDQWIWYAIASVIDYVDKIIIFDTGSTDNTVKIIKSINSKKIEFQEREEVSAQKLVDLRNEQIKLVKTPWFLVLDGDEVWPKDSINALVNLSKKMGSEKIGIVVKALLPVGDLHHYQDESAGRYELLDMKGHYNIRLYRKKEGYHWEGVYPLEAYVDNNGRSINDQDQILVYLKGYEYWHLRHLQRSSINPRQKKFELGKEQTVRLPEVFNISRPAIVPSPRIHFSMSEALVARFLTPLTRLKRSIVK